MSRRWSEERIRRELEAFLPGFDAWPPYPVFRATGRRGLWQAMVRRSGVERFAEEYGLPYTPFAWGMTEAEIRARLRGALRGSGVSAWPFAPVAEPARRADVVAAIDRTGDRPYRRSGSLGA